MHDDIRQLLVQNIVFLLFLLLSILLMNILEYLYQILNIEYLVCFNVLGTHKYALYVIKKECRNCDQIISAPFTQILKSY